MSFKNTYFDKLPREIIDYIWEFNHNDAACIINYYSRKFIIRSVSELKKLIKHASLTANLGYPMMGQYSLFYRNRIMNRDDVFLRMKACQCCKRHQILKPKKLEYWVESTFHYTNLTSCDCKCICRHYSRFLCRYIE